MNRSNFIKPLIVIILSLAVGFFAGMEYKSYQIRKVFSDALNEQTQQKTEQEQPKETVIEKNIGDEVGLATVKFKVNTVEEKQIINSKYGTPKVAKKDAKFVVINLDITNITNAPFTFSNSSGFVLIDNKDRRYAEYEDTIGGIDNYLTMRNLSPSITENGFIVYEVPSDVTSYILGAGKAGTNEVYRVILK